MNIALTRVDSRLVHGQIVESWIPATRATMIIVANDAVAREGWRASIMKACVPDDVTVQISRVDELQKLLSAGWLEPQNAILLFATIQDAVSAYEAGVTFTQLNLGNVHEHPGSRQVSETVYLNDDDVGALRKLQQLGVSIEIRKVSREKPIPASSFLR
jgi:PTS system mannose-specific IIB component